MIDTFYKKIDLKGSQVIDIGAHTGRHSIPLAAMVGSAGLVYCFEPVPVIRRVLCENIYLAGLHNVVVYPFALSDKSGLSNFKYVHNLPQESGLKNRHAYNGDPGEIEDIKVHMFKLDEVMSISVREKVRLIKIDVQGGELDVIRGAKNLIYASKPIVTFECGAASFLSYTSDPSEIYLTLSSFGYEIYSILGDQILTVAQFKEATFRQAFWDYVALPSGTSALASLLKAN
jgi:FkbM family methyltransferase